MKKHWVKRENIIYYNNYKPFYKQKLKVLLLFVFLMAIVFFVYQVYYVSQLSEGLEKSHVKYNDTLQQPAASAHIQDEKTERYIPRGIRLRDLDFYAPKLKNTTFKCFASGKELPFNKVNDNYCDCPDDGSDEPSTNACPRGVFYCRFQMRHKTGRGRDISIPSSRVNDKICDCCDGSDEEHVSCVNTCSSQMR